MTITMLVADMSYFSEYNIVVCSARHCQYAILPSQVASHLQEKHGCRKSIARDDGSYPIASILQSLHIAVGSRSFHHHTVPLKLESPIPYLPVHHGGFKCVSRTGLTGAQCSRIYRNVHDMQKHCREQHQWKSIRGPGRAPAHMAKPIETMWEKGITYQRIFRTGARCRLVEVNSSTRLLPSTSNKPRHACSNYVPVENNLAKKLCNQCRHAQTRRNSI
jgi:hypothetical protein